MEDRIDNISLQKENIRLDQERIDLIRENEYLRMLLERFIPIPINGQVESLENRYSDIDKRLKKIENIGNMAK